MNNEGAIIPPLPPEETQRSGGAQLEWKVGPSLTLQGSVESLVLLTAKQENSPVNTSIRGTWRF